MCYNFKSCLIVDKVDQVPAEAAVEESPVEVAAETPAEVEKPNVEEKSESSASEAEKTKDESKS